MDKKTLTLLLLLPAFAFAQNPSDIKALTIAAPLTGYTSTTGTIAASDNAVTAINKLNGNLAATTTTANNAAPKASPVFTGKVTVVAFSSAYAAKATSYTLTATDNVIEVTATGQTMTLPTAVGISGTEYCIKLTASGTVTVATTSSQTIDGQTTYTLSAQYKYVTVKSNNANWIIIGNN